MVISLFLKGLCQKGGYFFASLMLGKNYAFHKLGKEFTKKLIMNETEKNLEAETLKWLEKLEKRMKNTKLLDKKAEDSILNVNSYISDAKHFLNRKDYIKAFEAMVYAFGIYETLIDLEFVKEG